MGFVCAICSEGLDKRPGTNAGDVLPPERAGFSKLATTPCGHVFHTFCIQKWMGGGMANSNACPCCRKAIPQRTLLPLFPDSYDESLLMDQSSSQSSSQESDERIASIRGDYEKQVQTLKGQLQVQREETDNQAKLYALQCEEFLAMKHKFETEQHRSETFMMKWKQYETFKEMYEDMAKKHRKLEIDIQAYKHIQDHLDLSKIEVEQDLKIYSNYSLEEAIRKISGTKHMLHREVTNLRSKREADRVDKERMSRDVTKLRSTLMACTGSNNELQSLVDNLRDEVKRLRSLTKNGPNKSQSATTSTTNTNNKSDDTAIKSKSCTTARNILDHTILVEDSDDSHDEIDSDVGLMSKSEFGRKADKRNAKDGAEASARCASASTSASSKRRAMSNESNVNNSILDNSDIVFSDTDADKDNGPLSPLEVRIRSNIPGVPPINTPNPPATATKFKFKKPKMGSSKRK